MCRHNAEGQAHRYAVYGRDRSVTSSSRICQHHHPMQQLGQPKGSTDTETAALGHHPRSLAFPQGLAGPVSLLTDSVTNARGHIY